MNVAEKKLYAIERQLIVAIPKFKGLKPRPVKIVDNKDGYAAWATPLHLEIQKGWLKKHGSDTKQIDKLITHELIHYKLGADGRRKAPTAPHNAAFRKLAAELGCDIAVKDCVDPTHYYRHDNPELSAEMDLTPREEVAQKFSLIQAKKKCEKAYQKILKLCMKAELQTREKLVKEINLFKMFHEAMASALKSGSSFINLTRVVKIKGKKIPSRQSLVEKYNELLKKQMQLSEGSAEWKKIQCESDEIYEKMHRYYHLS